MIYTIIVSREAGENITYLKKAEFNAYKKVRHLFEELQEHPRIGTGKPEQLKYGHFKGLWSRRITNKHRLVYAINDIEVVVFVLSAKGHYSDK